MDPVREWVNIPTASGEVGYNAADIAALRAGRAV